MALYKKSLKKIAGLASASRRARRMLSKCPAGPALVAAIACDNKVECVPPPCPQPVAILVSVKTAGGSPIQGASLTLTVPAQGDTPCLSAGPCVILGGYGTYEFDVKAPGFIPVHRSIQVSGPATTPACGCAEHRDVAETVVLSPAS